jgi:hypothetical protein
LPLREQAVLRSRRVVQCRGTTSTRLRYNKQARQPVGRTGTVGACEILAFKRITSLMLELAPAGGVAYVRACGTYSCKRPASVEGPRQPRVNCVVECELTLIVEIGATFPNPPGAP